MRFDRVSPLRACFFPSRSNHRAKAHSSPLSSPSMSSAQNPFIAPEEMSAHPTAPVTVAGVTESLANASLLEYVSASPRSRPDTHIPAQKD